MKSQYTVPDMEIITFDIDDVITTSELASSNTELEPQ